MLTVLFKQFFFLGLLSWMQLRGAFFFSLSVIVLNHSAQMLNNAMGKTKETHLINSKNEMKGGGLLLYAHMVLNQTNTTITLQTRIPSSASVFSVSVYQLTV